MFGKEPNMSVDPDMAIAKGAAIHAANLLKSGGELEYADVTTHNIGIEVAGGKMYPILKKGTPMNGVGKEEGFKTVDKDQHWIHVQIYEGNSELIKDNRFLGKLTVDNLPKCPTGEAGIRVRLTTDT